ncbi:hypothetical protein [Pseudomonas fluorescens]|uniref:Uncharacterized protein n=1 Tax=Pseudomonas fluorescens TaxID=294 RepID=A0A5E7RXM9_PSEFL|nr:hypothetical protein [Pseudomonas fluorescens]VVP78308.1 hypothetical protein PS928_00468 [Pseudomonas fluorescens]
MNDDALLGTTSTLELKLWTYRGSSRNGKTSLGQSLTKTGIFL